MTAITEVCEVCIAILPVVLSIVLLRSKNTSARGWMVKIVGSTLFSLLQIGFLLRRLTATCRGSSRLQCDSFSSLQERIPGVFDYCYYCSVAKGKGSSVTDSFLVWLNHIALPVQAIGAVVTLAISLFITVAFVKAFRTTMRP